MASSMKRHRRAQGVKPGPGHRAPKRARAERAEAEQSLHGQWVDNWTGIGQEPQEPGWLARVRQARLDGTA